MPARKLAFAVPTSATTYAVSYAGCRDADRDVGYGYLKRLAARGYEVRVGGQDATPGHTLKPR